jgi:hypothetical protein
LIAALSWPSASGGNGPLAWAVVCALRSSMYAARALATCSSRAFSSASASESRRFCSSLMRAEVASMSGLRSLPSAASLLDRIANAWPALACVRPRHCAEISDFSRCCACSACTASTERTVLTAVKAAIAAIKPAVTTAGNQILAPRDNCFIRLVSDRRTPFCRGFAPWRCARCEAP